MITYLDVDNDVWVELALVGDTHLLGEGGLGPPAGGVAWGDLLEHAVDLLEGEALGLWHEHVGVDEATNAEGAPDEEDLCAEVALVSADHVWSDDGDDAVPQLWSFMLV